MAKIKVSDYIAKRLKEHGVERFFMVSGGGAMHLNDSLGREIPYTAFCALKDYLNANEETIQDFTDILYRAQIWVLSSTPEEVAKTIHPQFTSNSIEELTVAMEKYKEINAWSNNPFFSENALENLMKIMIEANELDNETINLGLYQKIVTTKYALNSMNK